MSINWLQCKVGRQSFHEKSAFHLLQSRTIQKCDYVFKNQCYSNKSWKWNRKQGFQKQTDFWHCNLELLCQHTAIIVKTGNLKKKKILQHFTWSLGYKQAYKRTWTFKKLHSRESCLLIFLGSCNTAFIQITAWLYPGFMPDISTSLKSAWLLKY